LDFLESLFKPHNLIFTLPLLLMLFNLLLQIFGLGFESLLGLGSVAAPGCLGAFFSFFHAGSVSSALIVQLLLGLYGLSGPLLNYFVFRELGVFEDWMHFAVTLPLALLVSGLGTKVALALVSSWFPASRTVACEDLVGAEADVVSGRVDRRFGRARVATASGETQVVACRLAEGEKPVEKGETVALVSFDAEANVFDCRRADRTS